MNRVDTYSTDDGIRPHRRYAVSVLSNRVPTRTLMIAVAVFSMAAYARAAEREIVALWSFDEDNQPSTMLADAGPHYWDLRLDTSRGALVPGRFGNALKPKGESGIATRWAMGSNPKNSRIAPFPYSSRELVRTLAAGDWTMEFWLCLDSKPKDEAVIVAIGPKTEAPLFQVSLSR
ncbi:MAG: hypothetical protein SGJ20_15225, partial [Planctomycetota bacterium]|nr:hypothetical protein [Planctomycetota bacterium]